MRRKLTLIVVALACAASASAGVPASGCWKLVPFASDDFASFDTARWSTALWYASSGVGTFSAANVTVTDGELVLTAARQSEGSTPYTFGAVESKFDIPGAPSYVEVRARPLTSKANVLSAVWMQSSPLTIASNPNPEIDIEETFSYDQLASSLHRWNVPLTDENHFLDAHHRYVTGVADSSESYHLYGLERRDGRLRFFFDGKLAWETTPAETVYVAQPRHLVLSLEGHLGQPVDAQLPAAFRIDYVHTYAPCKARQKGR